jgi:crotonobetainyl-CoA:carnitine CoA-transferase CaiB-like acyl-CoA transferase
MTGTVCDPEAMSPADESPRRGPLAGIQVVDLTVARAGPTCVRQLVDMGADAIQVVAPGVTPLPGSDGWNLHRGKRSIELDLRTPRGRDVLFALVDRADVLVENFRPQVKHRLDIGPEVMLSHNPRLVYASISGFGQDGPYADRPGVDQIAQGLGGLMSVTGPAGTGPWRTGIAIADTVSGTFLAQAVAAALYERERTGRGQWVHTSLLETMINIMDFQAARYLNEGEIAQQAGNEHPTLVPMGAFRTADGWVNVAPFGTSFDGFCAVMDAPELTADPRFDSGRARVANRAALSEEIERRLLGRPTSEWVDLFNAAGIPAGPVLAMDGVFDDPQVRHLEMSCPVEHPDDAGRSITVLRHPVTFAGMRTRPPGGPPHPGADTAALLAELDETR